MQIQEDERGKWSLLFSDFAPTEAIFEELGFDGGGYGWHGVVDALLRARAPQLRRKLNFDPEASMLVILSRSREALEQAAALIEMAQTDHDALRAAIQSADPDLMD